MLPSARHKAGIAIRYGLFAVIAIAVNLLTQAVVFALLGADSSIVIALAAGTLTGLVCKYLLDKHYIFAFKTANVRENGVTFMAYSLVGVFTTIIFWAFELGFDYFFVGPQAKYLGGAIGLTIGYLIKYQIDKRYVFVRREAAEHG